MQLKRKLLQFMRNPQYIPLCVSDIAREFNLNTKGTKQLYLVVKELLEKGDIVLVKKDRLSLPIDVDLISGVIKFRQNGSAVLVVSPSNKNAQIEIFSIEARNTSVALHGDTVLARKIFKKKYISKRGTPIVANNSEISARVIRVLKRANITLAGTLKKGRSYYFVIPDDPRIVQDILVANPNRSKLKPKIDDKVVVKLFDWEHPHSHLEGKIVEVLGVTHSPQAEYKAILHKYKLDFDFPETVMKEVEVLKDFVSESECEGRLDYRAKLTFTIDPDDAKDFDDALSIELLPDGDTLVGVHIADVSSYVQLGTELDKEAQRRGNSTYLVGSVIPMLPHKLSNGLCSLVENEDRLTKTVFLRFSSLYALKTVEFANTVIRSSKRLTYNQAYALLKEDSIAKIRELPLPKAHQTGSTGCSLHDLSESELITLQNAIRGLWKIALSIRRARFKNGSLELDIPEVKIFVDAEGRAEKLEKIEYDESHQLIEEFMLAANEAVAQILFVAQFPLIHRVHDKPDSEKLNELREFLIPYDIQVGDLTNRKEVVSLLHKMKSHSQHHILRIQFLRSLKQACYRAESDGHYGLNKTFYTHFTSPIRRYSDLVVHRIFDHYLIKVGHSTVRKIGDMFYRKSKLDSIAQHVSLTEQNSTDAERESFKIKLLEFFELELKKEKKSIFEAFITELRNHGLFIELSESMAFGYIHISSLKDDIYTLSPDGLSFVGRQNKVKWSIGQKVLVSIDRVDRFKRQLDFVFADVS